MRWMLLVCVVVGACGGAGAEMRPRGRRNSVKIEALSERIAAIEAHPVVSSAPTAALEARVKALEAALADVTAELKAVRAQVKLLNPPPVTSGAAQLP